MLYLAQMNALLQKLPQTKQHELRLIQEVITSLWTYVTFKRNSDAERI